MEFFDFLAENMYIVSVVLYFIGTWLKKAAFFKDAYIPFALSGLGILAGIGIIGFNTQAVLQGILAAGLSVMVNQFSKQLQKARTE